ncbi:SDR family NAD(P)-dependent oxidoreductase [Vibrio renipiscarius]|uniref:Oxidoreductase n=1 Tax=Vibrio renipiscarius TaxID=1461322 RepID=A0A0C2NH71_9VIBR|nr:SDR family NAD(P)-dependent oxidoreductase [Vibrio renipiscarius]KII75670.1 oxidoreductase [Vibrio renipiscarius]KII81880.1 oxidoreductase [Vibrio renipiscarius]
MSLVTNNHPVNNDFETKIALVLAGAQGIGRACSMLLAAKGAKVYIADWDFDLASATAGEINANSICLGSAVGVFFNAFDNETYATLIDSILEKEGRIDVLINNFGGVDLRQDRDLAHTEVTSWEKNILANINSVFIPSKAVIPTMVKQGGGAIVNISSLSSLSAEMSSIAYGTSKNAINHMTRQIAIQYANFGIRCNAVLPGMIATDAVKKNLTQEYIDHFLATQPIKRMGEPDDIANAVSFLASDKASFITGVCLPVTGGMDIATSRYYFDVDKVQFE